MSAQAEQAEPIEAKGIVVHDRRGLKPAPAPTPPASEAAAILSMIERVASNPNADLDKMERLYAMRERVAAQEAERAYNEAMSAVQAELRPVATDAANPQTKSRYASYAALDKAVRPIYSKHGFALSFYSGEGAPADHVRVTCKVSCGGHSERPFVDMPADGKGAKGGDVMTKTHAAGSAFSYGQRYLLKLIFNIAVGEDDDGNAAGREQSAAVSAAIAGINLAVGLEGLRKWKAANAAALSNLPTAEADAIIRHFNDRHRKLKEAAEPQQ